MSKRDIDALHTALVDQVNDDISDCLDAGHELRLSPGEVTGICAAALISTVTHLMVVSGTPEHIFLTWCHDHYLAMQKHCRDQRLHEQQH